MPEAPVGVFQKILVVAAFKEINQMVVCEQDLFLPLRPVDQKGSRHAECHIFYAESQMLPFDMSQRRVETDCFVVPSLFRSIERIVHDAHEFIPCFGLGWEVCIADGHGIPDPIPAVSEFLNHLRSFPDPSGPFFGASFPEDDTEFIAAGSSDQPIRKSLLQEIRQPAERSVSGRMAVQIVDQLEIIQIQKGTGHAPGPGIPNPFVQMGDQPAPVIDARQSIVVGRCFQFLILSHQNPVEAHGIQEGSQKCNHRQNPGEGQTDPVQIRRNDLLLLPFIGPDAVQIFSSADHPVVRPV